VVRFPGRTTARPEGSNSRLAESFSGVRLVRSSDARVPTGCLVEAPRPSSSGTRLGSRAGVALTGRGPVAH
jgi:hypothetical protein